MKKLLLSATMLAAFTLQAQQVVWEEKATGFTNTSTGVNEFSWANQNDVWLTGYDGSGGGATFQVFSKSSDGGETWTAGNINLGSTDLGIGSISAVSGSTAWVAAFPNAATVQGGIWKTTDGGVTWTKQPSASFNTGTDSFTNWVHFWDENNGVCMGDPAGGYFEVYTTTNGGATWTRVPSSNLPVPLDGEYGYTRNYEVSGDTVWFGTNKGRLVRSSNRGLTWDTTAYQSPSSDFGDASLGGSYSFADNATDGIYVGRDWTESVTTDGGATWTSVSPSGTIRNFDVTYVPGVPNFLINVGEDVIDGLRGSSFSNDNGLTWTDINAIDELDVDGGSGSEFYDATHGLTSGFNASPTAGGVWKWITDANLFLATDQFQANKAFTASPNPTFGALDISGKNISSVQVFDVLGKQVFNANYSAMNAVKVDLSVLNSGVYMVKVVGNEGAATIKVVKQ